MGLRHLVIVLVLLGLLAAGAGYAWLVAAMRMEGPQAKEAIVFIAPATPTKKIAAQLAAENVISSPLAFEIAARFQRKAGGLKAGEYLIPPRASINDVVAILQSGKVYQRRLTVPEGLMSVEIAALVNAAEALEGTIDTPPPEGTLLPETYSYTRGETRQALVDRMQAAMQKTVDAVWQKRAPHAAVTTPFELVILASIVEKETALAAERPRVAGVFTNRLRVGMPLQSDPTVIYAATEGRTVFDRPIRRSDLARVSPYNTYLNKGLTPGPIANPGRASLEAVADPEQHGYFYFVADGTGGHAFAETLDGHTRNVGKWRAIEAGRQP